MAATRPISTAPLDGRRVRIVWTDEDGQENEAPGRHWSLERLKAMSPDAEESEAGWWVFVDSSTQKKVKPEGWISAEDEKNRDEDD